MYNPKSTDLERDYFPSYHTIRFQDQPAPNLAVQLHFLQLTKQQGKDLTTKQGIKVDHLRYGGQDDRQIVDVFYNDSTTDSSPLFVYVHGGYWQFLDITESCSMVGPLVRRGYRVAVMDYNLCPQVTLEQLMLEFTNFLNWTFAYAEKIKTTEIHFAGHSAGGHMLAQILNAPEVVTPERRKNIRSLIFICGVYDLRELWSLENVNPNNILGLNAEKAAALSPILWKYPDAKSWSSIKFHVMAAEHESLTFIEQSRVFGQVLEKAGFPTSFKVIQGYDHFDIIEETAIDDSIIAKNLQEILKL
ncbi:GL26102 [Drosophila persimilis]|uniref:Kynurenine formamidase n=2 Tax=pseudoobscura subgroup TaxID=32358 RepID=A0A6I8V7K7_DROPS|nr:kynurenine formamidase isoform X2 [Drosophila persimilis]XP_015035350.2 kynurenine formamidase isoform X2 [Drosophila pseudoobscura]EDW37167.1 GL26102 [Drosophila persimilis]